MFDGTLVLSQNTWELKAKPHVLRMIKRVFISTQGQFDVLKISNTIENCELLHWVCKKFDFEFSDEHRTILEDTVYRAIFERNEARAILDSANIETLEIPTGMKLEPRSYQLQASHVLRLRNSLLVGDDYGLGKTVIGITSMSLGMLPAIVVCQTHLQHQWAGEIPRFLSGAVCHIVKQNKEYKFPKHNVLIIPYSKLAAWADTLAGNYCLIVFDEAQELRRDGTKKYAGASYLANSCDYKLALTATPIYNYGDEMFNVLDLIQPYCLGERYEFYREWCTPHGMHYKVTNPRALGSYLAESGLFLRRRRKELGKQLPAITQIKQEVAYDSEGLFRFEETALELAKAILKGPWDKRGQAARELSSKLRQQTGLAKAPFVADFVCQLVGQGEKVLLSGWHHEVYRVWKSIFDGNQIKAVFYNGEASVNAKRDAVNAFIQGDAQVFVMSLRSGAGLEGLQRVCSIVVHGELDWAPKVHEQLAARINRDGQENPVVEVFLYAEAGADPVIIEVLGIKSSQSEGIINPESSPIEDEDDVISTQVEESRGVLLAQQILNRASQPNEEAVNS